MDTHTRREHLSALHFTLGDALRFMLSPNPPHLQPYSFFSFLWLLFLLLYPPPPRT